MKNFKSPASASKQKGFSLLTGFILVIVLFGALAFFLAGRGINTTFGTTYANSTKVSNLVASSAYLRTGFDAVVLGGTSADAVTFDGTATTGIFNMDSGAATKQAVDPSALAPKAVPLTTEGYWIYGKNAIDMTGVGGDVNGDFTVLLIGLKKGICQQINNSLNGTPVTTAPAVTGTIAALVGAPTVLSPVSDLVITLGTPNIVVAGGNPSGCFETADADPSYVFIHTVYPQ